LYNRIIALQDIIFKIISGGIFGAKRGETAEILILLPDPAGSEISADMDMAEFFVVINA
jgi:hypothetical protein